ncbi:MAG TPA: GAF domain-containing protein [Pseudonocardiaceae bacterium]
MPALAPFEAGPAAGGRHPDDLTGGTGDGPRAGEPDERDVNQRLLDAVMAIGAELELDVVLRRIVEAAMDLVDANYGALGVLAQDRVGLDRLVHVGMDQRTVDAIGAQPTFCGVLGLLVDEPLRTADIATHPRSYGFPLGHPRMRSFLGVPIRVRESVFGNLYLTEKATGGEFTEADEAVATALAAAAGAAVQKARLYEQSRRRGAWLQAGSDVTRLLLSGAEEAEVLTAVAAHVRELSDATDTAVLVPAGDGRLRVAAATGPVATTMLGRTLGPPAHAEFVFRAAEPLNLSETQVSAGRLADPAQPEVGPTLLVPIGLPDGVRGVLAAARPPGSEAFSREIVPAVQGFAEQAELAYELAERRRDSEALSLFADRDRIARNLHDLVIQRLFATGMALEGAANLVSVNPGEATGRIRRAVTDLDTTIKEIRTTVFALQHPADVVPSLRMRVIEAVDAAADTLGLGPSVRFEGLVDTTVADEVADHLVAVLREALSNVARHAEATAVGVSVAVAAGEAGQAREVILRVSDNGVGVGLPARRGGLANMTARAEGLGGHCTVEDGAPGTVICWAVPLPAPQH